MKKYLLLFVAVLSLSVMSCKQDAAQTDGTKTELTVDEAAPAAELVAPTPSGDADKDAKACVEYLIASLEKLDFTGKDSDAASALMKEWEAGMSKIQKDFEAAYPDGDKKKAFEEAAEKYSKELGLEEKILEVAKKAMSAAVDGEIDKLKENKTE